MLYNLLSQVSALWSIGHESKAIIERFHHPRVKGWESGALEASDLTAQSRAYIPAAFERQAAPGTFWRRVNGWRTHLRQNRLWRWIKQRGQSDAVGSGISSGLPQQGMAALQSLVRLRNLVLNPAAPIRLLEKTPENCLRLPFLLTLFPDARVIYLVRDGRGNVNSLLEGWKQPHLFPGYRVPVQLHIPGYSRDRWGFTLIPGWRELTNRPLEEVCAWQWIRCNEAVLAHHAATAGRVPYLTVRYEELVSTPSPVLRDIAAFIGVDFERELGRFARHLPQINVVSAPAATKWRQQNPDAIRRIEPLIEPMMKRLGYGSSSR